MATSTQAKEGVNLPLPIVIGLALFVLTSAPTVLYVAGAQATRITAVEERITRLDEATKTLPAKVEALDTRTGLIYDLLKDIQKDLRAK